ncbi:MAG: hypothetical protein JKY04_07975 [Sneathiella sp.]|nr:hypothetical protein [Sneathiella sp.]
MQIEPYILLPIAALFVSVVIVFIRLVAGPRNATVTEEKCLQLMAFEEPDTSIDRICVSQDNKAALLLTGSNQPIRLVRQHGDKLVLQTPDISDIKTGGGQSGLIQISRQDFSHPEISILCGSREAKTWQNRLEKLGATFEKEAL